MSEKFYERLVEGDFESDREASQYFFGEQADENERRYKELKERLYARLLNTVFFVDPNKLKFNKYQRAYYELARDITAADILLKRFYYKNGLKLLQKNLKKARKYAFTQFEVNILLLLKEHFGNRLYDKKMFTKYNTALKEVEEVLKAEKSVEDYRALTVMAYHEDRADLAYTHQVAKKYFEKTIPLLEKYNSPRLHVFGRFLELIMYSANRDFDGIISTCRKAVAHFEDENYSNPTQVAIFHSNEAIAHLQLSNYPEGIASVNEAIKLQPEKSNNWANSLNILFLINLHAGDFDAAHEIMKKVLQPKIFSRMLPQLQESWRIGEAYIYFLIEAGVLNVPKRRNLKVGRFLNQVPKFSKGYRVTNVPILIIQILFAILRKEYDKSINRMESVNRYVSRYLRNDNTFRSNCFIKMLLCIPAANFNRIATERRAAKYLQRLKASPVVQVEQTHEVEYIPYEKLWEITLSLLDTSTSRYWK
ncbi:MAG: hypothetical protein AAGG68_21245 [Bacteroidota bacterium]